MRFFVLFVVLTFALPSFADTFYIRHGGTADSKDNAVGPCKNISACGDDRNINSWASAGDTVNICSDGGDIITTITASGACNNGLCQESDRIVYQKAPDSVTTPSWDANNKIADIKGTRTNYKEYITLKDLVHTEYNANGRPVEMSYIKNVVVDHVDIDIDPSSIYWDGWMEFEDAENLIVQNCTMDSGGATADSEINGFVISERVRQFLIYNNTFGSCTHVSLFLYSDDVGASIEQGVIRGNTFENLWEHPLALGAKSIIEADNGRYLIEQNTFKNNGSQDDSSPCVSCEADQTNYFHVAGHQIITRDNIFYGNDIDIGWDSARNGTNTYNDWKHYNNSHYNSSIPDKNTEGGVMFQVYDADDTLKGLAVINNIFWKYKANQNGRDVQIFHDGMKLLGDRVENNIFGRPGPNNSAHTYRTQDEQSTSTCNTNLSQWSGNQESDPLYTDPPNDFTPSSTKSPALNKGTYLTEVNDSNGGAGTSMVVDDATFFYAGDWNIPGGAERGDFIYVDNTVSKDFIVQIIGVDYSNDTLKLESSQNWDDGAKVYWCPLRDETCFYGSGPDIGAIESKEEQQSSLPKKIQAPVSLRIQKSLPLN